MLVLVIDTATPAITAAVAELTDASEPVTLRGQRITVDARAHGELLSPQIKAVLGDVGVKPRDLEAVVAGVGPGPFTGLRVGLMTATAFSFALGIPAYGVCTLDALGAVNDGRVLVATDARRREVYWAVYSDRRRVTEPAVNRPADVAAALADQRVSTGIGEGAHKYADVLGIAAGQPNHPPPTELARLAADRALSRAPGEPLTPLYLRRPDAVEPSARKRALP